MFDDYFCLGLEHDMDLEIQSKRMKIKSKEERRRFAPELGKGMIFIVPINPSMILI